jgi:D-alanyl-D-alanine dipeptidase
MKQTIVLGGVLLTLAFFLVSCASKPDSVKSGEDAEIEATPLPEGFVALRDVDATVVHDIRYAGDHNFVGRPIRGYRAAKCLLTKPAAEALSQVQTELRLLQMSLKVYDCYRPQRAVDDFVEWSKDPEDRKMKKEFYPGLQKSVLFRNGYIAEKSGHSRGSTVDLTLVVLPLSDSEMYRDGQPLLPCTAPLGKRFADNSVDMGTGYDCFDPLAHTASAKISRTQRQNRQLLVRVMKKHGFENYDKEWWHFTLKSEPFPETAFDFEIR